MSDAYAAKLLAAAYPSIDSTRSGSGAPTSIGDAPGVAGRRAKRLLRIFSPWLVALICALPIWSVAKDISERLPSGLIAHGDFRPGSGALPAVLVLHGFMTTQNFTTIQTIVNELDERGYTVLAPTLTLGIDERRGGLSCGAIHTHTMEEDLTELSWWVNWLAKRHPGPLVLIGHSSGSLQAIAYAAAHPIPQLRMVIATSPVYFGEYYPPDLVAAQIARAEQQRRSGSSTLDRYALTFCNRNFVATPKSYLSYAAWDRSQVLASVRDARVPVKVVFGTADPRATSEWQDGLRQAGAAVKLIPGATHFFDATHEFELLDLIRDALRSVDDGQSGDHS